MQNSSENEAAPARRPARVLFASVPQTGHVTPLLPLARALAEAGADVTLASGPDVGDAVAGAGIDFRPVGTGLGSWFGTLAGRIVGQPGDGLPPERVERYFIPRLFAEVGVAAMLDDLDDAVGELEPDLMIFEEYALAAPLAAARHGVRAVQHTVGLRFDPIVTELVIDAVTPAWRASGLPAPAAAGFGAELTIDICPPAFSPDLSTAPSAAAARGHRVLAMRPTPLPDRTATLPVQLPRQDRPLVNVTLGTFNNSNAALFRTVLTALADLPVNVLVTAGSTEAAVAIGTPPANAVVAGFVPHAVVSPHCAAVVHHAGAGTTFGALAHGLPAVALPQSADNFRLAERLETAGAGRALPPGTVDERTIRDAVRAVLTEPGYRRRAAAIAGEIAAMPAPIDVAATLLAAAPQLPSSRKVSG